MRIFNFFKQTDIHKGLKKYAETENAVLLDVRTPQEYREGHIPGSKNVPLQTIGKVASGRCSKAAPGRKCDPAGYPDSG